MDEATISALAFDPAARARWVHDLRNAVNLLGIGNKLAQRLLEKERPDDARAALDEGLHAWERCRELLALAPEATRLPEARLAEIGGIGEQAHR